MSARSALVRQLPCVACASKFPFVQQHSPTEEHHLNLDGHAGQVRRGDEYSIPLCGWHHRGVSYPYTAAVATAIYGPSLARGSRKFRAQFGTDDQLLELTNEQLKDVA